MEAHYFTIIKLAFFLYILALVVAAVCDVWKFIIPNLLSIFLIALFFLVAISSPFEVPWWSHLAAGAGFLVVGFGLYAFKMFGAGDVKLLTAVALWAGHELLLDLILYVALAGGAVSLFLIIARRIIMSLLVTTGGETLRLPKVLVTGEAVPYGVGIAIGGLLIVQRMPLLGYTGF